MASYIGQVPEFVPTKQKWVVCIAQENTFFVANDIEDDTKRAVLLTSMGITAYTTLRNFYCAENANQNRMERATQAHGGALLSLSKFYCRALQVVPKISTTERIGVNFFSGITCSG